jgi:predicted signal transduction protein with EAL and GGDEF domain
MENTFRGQREVYSQEFRMRTRSGSGNGFIRPGKLLERDEKGQPLRMLGIHKDISEQKKNAARLEYLATHDVLTGLANRVLLRDRLEQSIHFAHRSGVWLRCCLSTWIASRSSTTASATTGG